VSTFRKRLIRVAYEHPGVVRRKVLEILKFAFTMSLDEAYRFMGLSSNASPEDVKGAYRKLSLKYHPDRGGDLVKMQKLNVARETIESGGSIKRPTPTHEQREEAYWGRYKQRFGPKPSGRYSDSDLKKFAQDVLDKHLRQVIYRHEVPWVPFDASTSRGGRWTYWRPFGSKSRTQRLPPETTADDLYKALSRFGKGTIFDVVVKDKEAWVTWEYPSGRYQSISFQEVKRAQKKKPGVGMTPDAIRSYLTNDGLDVVAGGTKYAYWGVRGWRDKVGAFIRESKRTLRVVVRERTGRAIQDFTVSNEVYFGKLTPALLDKWIKYVKTKATEK